MIAFLGLVLIVIAVLRIGALAIARDKWSSIYYLPIAGVVAGIGLRYVSDIAVMQLGLWGVLLLMLFLPVIYGLGNILHIIWPANFRMWPWWGMILAFVSWIIAGIIVVVFHLPVWLVNVTGTAIGFAICTYPVAWGYRIITARLREKRRAAVTAALKDLAEGEGA